ncbi:MAG: hypothetical protein IPH94_15915 [Saprospiraceae bacterium]|nr:hypothetical protein [Saprospiraceae bacterium]
MMANGQPFSDTLGNGKMHFESNYTSWSPPTDSGSKMNKIVEENGFRRFQTEEPFLPTDSNSPFSFIWI